MPPRRAVTYPSRRRELLLNVSALADRDYQERVWVRQDFPHEGFYDDFDEVIHFFFDDSDLAEDPFNGIGDILLDEEEARLCHRLTSTLDSLLTEYGDSLSDAQYISTPEWNAIISAAKAFLLKLKDEERAP